MPSFSGSVVTSLQAKHRLEVTAMVHIPQKDYRNKSWGFLRSVTTKNFMTLC
jgi:hypothetical protein